MNRPTVHVVGAGVSGLSAAVNLAASRRSPNRRPRERRDRRRPPPAAVRRSDADGVRQRRRFHPVELGERAGADRGGRRARAMARGGARRNRLRRSGDRRALAAAAWPRAPSVAGCSTRGVARRASRCAIFGRRRGSLALPPPRGSPIMRRASARRPSASGGRLRSPRSTPTSIAPRRGSPARRSPPRAGAARRCLRRRAAWRAAWSSRRSRPWRGAARRPASSAS